MKIELRIQQYDRQTDRHTHRHTEWLLELLVGAKKNLVYVFTFGSAISHSTRSGVMDILILWLLETIQSSGV